MNKSTIYHKNKVLKDSGIVIKGVHVIIDRQNIQEAVQLLAMVLQPLHVEHNAYPKAAG